MSKPVYLFISPHLDDAALSCGGYIFRLTAAVERVVIVTVVTADAPAGTPLSWLMQRNHRAWRLGDTPFAARRQEDAAAAKVLGAHYVHLDLLDVMYRCDEAGRPFYTKNSVRVPLHPQDGPNQERLVRQKLQELSRTYGDDLRVFCPLTLGEHVDHIIIRRAVETWVEPARISYYEDYPYAGQARIALADFTPPDWRSTTLKLTPAEIEARIAAVACYTSQVAGLFPSPLERWLEIARARLPLIGSYVDWPPDWRATRQRMASSLMAYITRVGGERYWHSNEAGELSMRSGHDR
jgi:LmbE family N-acetylglucosaminyl deacetylase